MLEMITVNMYMYEASLKKTNINIILQILYVENINFVYDL